LTLSGRPASVRRLKTPSRPTHRASVERLWRRAEEIRSLCGLPPFTGEEAGAPASTDPASLAPLVEILLRDLETNFRRELATRVQMEGLGELFSWRESEPGRTYQTLVTYLSRALDEPRLWLGVVDGSSNSFTLYLPANPDAGGEPHPEAVPALRLPPEWLRWVALGEGEDELWTGPSGSRSGGPWRPIAVRGEIAVDPLTGVMPACPGSLSGGGACLLSRRDLEEMAGGDRSCGPCQFRHIVAVVGIEGDDVRGRFAQLEAIAPSLGPVLVNLGLRENLSLEARFRNEVIENLPLGVVAVDLERRVLAWNRGAEAILGLDRERARAATIPRVSAASSWQHALILSLDEGETTVRAEHEVVRPDGTRLPVEVSTAPLRDVDGSIRGAVATLLDVSSLKHMEDRIRQLDRLAALGRFASSVAHELRNPLTGIATGVQYLSRGFPEGDERHESVAFILREVVRLNTIIQDLFTATKQREVLARPARVADVVEWALRGLAPAIEASGVRIERPDADTWPTVLGDADQLQQVLLNLIQNAVQASEAGAAVVVRAYRREGERPGAVIEVEDAGHGIPADELPRIFEPFFTTRPKGTGLGLFVAHGIVQRHGGALEVESEAGRGTRFRVVLPETKP
jgi:PAS domain S-box-containing protein